MIEIESGSCHGSRTCSACGDGDDFSIEDGRFITERNDLNTLRVGYHNHRTSMTLCDACVFSMVRKLDDHLDGK